MRARVWEGGGGGLKSKNFKWREVREEGWETIPSTFSEVTKVWKTESEWKVGGNTVKKIGAMKYRHVL